jgi:hypothetical protein
VKTPAAKIVTDPESLRRDLVNRVLATKPAAHCDACLALGVKAALDETREAAEHLALDANFQRTVRVCAQCGRTLSITSAR